MLKTKINYIGVNIFLSTVILFQKKYSYTILPKIHIYLMLFSFLFSSTDKFLLEKCVKLEVAKIIKIIRRIEKN